MEHRSWDNKVKHKCVTFVQFRFADLEEGKCILIRQIEQNPQIQTPLRGRFDNSIIWRKQ